MKSLRAAVRGLLLFGLSFFSLAACGESDEGGEGSTNQIIFQRTGEVTLNQSCNDGDVIYLVNLSNPNRVTATAQLSVYTPEELAAYNQEHGTSYRLLTTDMYTLNETNVAFSGEESKSVRFVLHTDALVAQIKQEGVASTYCLPLKLSTPGQSVIYLINLTDIADALRPEAATVTFRVVDGQTGELITDNVELIVQKLRADYNAYVPYVEQSLTAGLYFMQSPSTKVPVSVTVVTANYNPKNVEMDLEASVSQTVEIRLEPRSGTRILSYNVKDGWDHNQANIDAFTEWVQRFDPDIIMFCELNNNNVNGIKSDEQLLELSRKWGHDYAVVLKDWGYPTGISSRSEITDVDKVQIEGLDGYRVHGFIQANCRDLTLFACHLSSQYGPLREKEAGVIAERAAACPLAFVAGDMNTDSPLDRDLLTPGTWPDKTGRNPVSIEYSVVPKYIDAGLQDVLLQHTKAFKASFSFGRNLATDALTGLRLDQAYATPALAERVDFADILNTAYTRGSSDHFPGLYHVAEP